MREIPDRTVDAILVLRYGYARDWPGRRDAIQRDFVAASDPALGPDRLVVAGPYEQEIAARLESAAERMCIAEGSDWTDEVTRDHICTEGRQWLQVLGLLPEDPS